jgi:predicted aconitase with swiveling domain
MNDRAGWTAEARPLLGGLASGTLLVLDEPLSMWGGLDPSSGLVIDTHHSQHGTSLAGRLVALPAGRGSSSSSSVLAEALRLGTGPHALLLAEPDGILLVGALVARMLYGSSCPVLLLEADDHRRLRTGDKATVDRHHRLHVRPLT